MSGRVTLAITTVTSSGGKGTTRTVTAPGFALPHRPQAPVTTMTTATARSLGLTRLPPSRWPPPSACPRSPKRTASGPRSPVGRGRGLTAGAPGAVAEPL